MRVDDQATGHVGSGSLLSFGHERPNAGCQNPAPQTYDCVAGTFVRSPIVLRMWIILALRVNRVPIA